MRATTFVAVSAFLASGVLGAPSLNRAHQHLHKRQVVDVEYATDVVTATDVATVTAGAQAAATPAPAAPTVQAPAPAAQVVSSASAAAPAPVSSASAAASSAVASAAAAPNDYAQAILDAHNVHRANNSAPALTWNQDLADAAAMLSNACNFAHNTQYGIGGYGQNLAASTGNNDNSMAAGQISNGWYNGEIGAFEGQYGLGNPGGNFEAYGHYTQMVWKASTEVGCASTSCGNIQGAGFGGVLLTCNYMPAGNVVGSYAANVGQPQGNPTVTGS